MTFSHEFWICAKFSIWKQFLVFDYLLDHLRLSHALNKNDAIIEFIDINYTQLTNFQQIPNGFAYSNSVFYAMFAYFCLKQWKKPHPYIDGPNRLHAVHPIKSFFNSMHTHKSVFLRVSAPVNKFIGDVIVLCYIECHQVLNHRIHSHRLIVFYLNAYVKYALNHCKRNCLYSIKAQMLMQPWHYANAHQPLEFPNASVI